MQTVPDMTQEGVRALHGVWKMPAWDTSDMGSQQVSGIDCVLRLRRRELNTYSALHKSSAQEAY
jgi:hypothetical protein